MSEQLDDARWLVHERPPRVLRQHRRDGRSDAGSASGGLALTPEQGRRMSCSPTSGSGKGNIYMVLPKYQYIMNAAYQAKWNITRRHELPVPAGVLDAVLPGSAPAGSADLLSPHRQERSAGRRCRRLPAAERALAGWTSQLGSEIPVSLRRAPRSDIFNMFNNSTVLGRQINLSSATTFNQVARS